MSYKFQASTRGASQVQGLYSLGVISSESETRVCYQVEVMYLLISTDKNSFSPSESISSESETGVCYSAQNQGF